ncbi:MAG: acyl-CoA thioesterase [Jatrophihabitans sp.]|nr:MAG: acyl-CoA thioesterase [Jatrophihabitans sp.]
MSQPIWSAPVRYAEVDQQNIVFNAHYLTYCDEASTAYFRAAGLLGFAEGVRLVTSTITWRGSARWGDEVAVTARCTATGRTSVTFAFTITASGRPCCEVSTVYVYADASGVPQPIPDDVRARLRGDQDRDTGAAAG